MEHSSTPEDPQAAQASQASQASQAPHRRALGVRGEELAASHLTGLGYRILERNWQCREGELDIIARDGDCAVAIEVKTRSGVGYGHPLEAITPVKAARLRRLLISWAAVAKPQAPRLRVDAIGIILRVGEQPVIEHLRGIR